MPPATTLYDLLGVAPQATAEEIAAALQTSREAAQGDGERLALLAVAHDTLAHAARRAAYDRTLQRRAADPDLTQLTTGGRSPRRAAAWFAGLLLVATAAATLALGRRAPPPAVTGQTQATAPPHAPAPAAGAPAQAAEENAADEAPAVASATPPADSAVAPSSAPEPAPGERSGGSVTLVPRSRGVKASAFDARYLAYSVFHVNQRRKFGSGVLIANDRVLTNCHVLAGGATNDIVVVHSVTGKTSKVEKYARLDDEDACLLLAPGAGNDTITWGDSNALAPGDTLHTFGHPGGTWDIVWSSGRLIDRIRHKGETFLFSSNVCLPGSSGGPVLDDNGRLVGIVMGTLYFKSKTGEAPRYRDCIAVTEETARALLRRPMFPIALAPAQYLR
ncbi:MAG: hypothetical protein E6Q99_06345 [Elusimicrobia bacterium]|nr:MAG: hypothetical protein E6Q99_06345 [Elusimicrobiota bacterium]